MSPVKNDLLTQQLIKNLDLTNQLVRELTSDFHEGELDFAKLNIELNHLIEQFKELSTSLDQTDEILLNINLKIAILEKTVHELESWSKERKRKDQEIENELTDKRGRWQLFTALVTGVIGILGSLIAIILNYLNK